MSIEMPLIPLDVTTPVLLLDCASVRVNIRSFATLLPGVDLYYAAKCNSHPLLLESVADSGIGCEIASPAELQLAVRHVPPQRLMCLHPVKSPAFLAELKACGVRVLAADCEAELEKIAIHAPGSEILVRVAVSNAGSRHQLDGKFGCDAKTAVDLSGRCDGLGLIPLGTTMHVGSQCTEPDTWAAGIDACHEVLRRVPGTSVLSLGGGFPAVYAGDSDLLEKVTSRIRACLPGGYRITAEPGRAIVATAGVLVASVLGVAIRDDEFWVYLDAGIHHGLFESQPATGAFRHPITLENPARPPRPTTLAGPTCDGRDIIARDIMLPELVVGDRVRFHCTGAYSTTLATHFNGFPPPEVMIVNGPAAVTQCVRDDGSC